VIRQRHRKKPWHWSKREGDRVMRNISLRRDVEDELEWEPSIHAAEIGVAVCDGVVSLTGFVPSFAEKLRATKVAQRVRGVQAVANDLELRLPGTDQRIDSDIARAAVAALAGRTLVPDGRIKVSVSNGWVYLDGDVEWQYQKRAAVDAVHSLIGVKGVIEKISIKPEASSSEVISRIEAALRRSAELDAHQVRVESHDGKVTLIGQLHSWSQREDAERMAWSAPGVSEVENRIMVTP
jgi:osmotically-inducible protein OsmY